MNKKNLSELSDQELLQEAKKLKTATFLNAVLIGFLIGIILYSIVKNSLGLLTLILLFFAYKLINNSRYDQKDVDSQLKARKLK